MSVGWQGLNEAALFELHRIDIVQLMEVFGVDPSNHRHCRAGHFCESNHFTNCRYSYFQGCNGVFTC